MLLIAGDLLLFALVVPLVLIKGFGLEAIVILVLLNAVMLVRTWKNYAVMA